MLFRWLVLFSLSYWLDVKLELHEDQQIKTIISKVIPGNMEMQGLGVLSLDAQTVMQVMLW